MSQEGGKVYFKERRCFVQNLAFDVEFSQLKDLFKNECGVQDEPFVQMLINPDKNKPSGAALVEFQSLEDQERAMSIDGQEKLGRKFVIDKETRDDDCIKKFCRRNNWSVTLDRRGRARIERNNGMNVDTSRGGPNGANVCTSKKDRRVFIHNMSYDVNWGNLKDYLKDAGTEGGFVEFLTKEDGTAAGAAVVDFKTDHEVEKVLTLDGNDFKGRKLFVNRDVDCFHLRRWCEKHGFDFFMDERGNKVNIKRKGSSYQVPQNHGSAPPPAFGSQQIPQTIDNKPLITEIPDLLKVFVFVSNLSFETREGFIMKHFSRVAFVKSCEIFKETEGDNAGKSKGMALLEFDRARDARRAVIMLHDTELDGRRIRVRDSNDRRKLPEGLSELGRPAPETACIDMCRAKNVDPYAECTLFMANAPFEMTPDEMKEIFRLVGDCFHADLFKKNGRNAGVGVAKFKHAYDAQQAINVLNDASFKGRKLAVRYDNEPRPGSSTHAPAPVYGQTYRNDPAPNFVGAPRSGQPSGDTNAQVQQLASLLGIDGATLDAIRIMKSGGAAPEPKRETYNSNDTYRARERSPHRESHRNDRDGYGFNNRDNGYQNRDNGYQNRDNSYQNRNNGYQNRDNGYRENNYSSNRDNNYRNDYNSRQQDAPQQQQQQQQPQAQVKTESKNWSPITNDTIYIRNLPGSMNENQLRFMFNQCGQISFMDFPVKSDGTPVGYSYIRYDGPDCKRATEQAVDKYNMFFCDGSKLEVGLY